MLSRLLTRRLRKGSLINSQIFSFSRALKRSAATTENGESSNMSVDDKKNLKERLTPLQYHVTQEAGTERPFTGKYNKFYEKGTYVCVVCKQDLFSSDTKYDSGCGWPAFFDVLEKGRVTLHADPSIGTVRTEVRCSKCSAHMGHVFGDGPKEKTGKRFCINSASIEFIEAGTEMKN